MNALLLNNYFMVGSLKIYYYAICIVSGFLACAAFGINLFKKRGLNPDLMIDLFIAVIPCSIILARTWYVVFDFNEFFVDGHFTTTVVEEGLFKGWNIPDFINIRNGGMAIHGGVLGGALGLFIMSKIKKIKFSVLGDLGATLLPLGQAVGRLGNFFNQEVYGAVVPEDKAWFPYATYIEADGQWHVALCFHEMFFNLLLFAFLYYFLFRYNGKRNGYSIGLYFLFYGIIRACMEPMRASQYNMGELILGMPTMFWLSLVIMAGGIAILTTLVILDVKDKDYWWKTIFSKTPKKATESAPDGNGGAAPDGK